MSDAQRVAREAMGASIAALLLVTTIDLLTNSIDIGRFDWDFRYYIDMAERGFGASLASPFAYRYLTPMLARVLSFILQLPTAGAFAVLAYIGAISQLLAVFLFVRWYARSTRRAWFAMLITAFSMYNVKFLLFDTFRPDHLAFPLILLQVYFALSRRFAPLLLLTMLGCQIREFNAVPLLAYMFASVAAGEASGTNERRRRMTAEAVLSIVGLGLALILPRVLIPVSEDFQFASLTHDGVLRVLLAPFVLARDANFMFSVVAYALPVLILGSPRELRTAISAMSTRHRAFLGAYAGLVLALSFLGGTDFARFSAYLLVPQSILLGLLSERRRVLHLVVVLILVFAFNRIWLPIPTLDLDAYLDFYGGYGTRLTGASLLRIAECVAFIGIGLVTRRLLVSGTERPLLAPK